MSRRHTEIPVPPSSLHALSAEIAGAESYALLQRVEIYPARLRREVVRQCLSGLSDTAVATMMRVPVNDVHAIMEAFNEVAEEQAI
jgi:DNA-directed RNA polymerase specialized sigma24 family protein